MCTEALGPYKRMAIWFQGCIFGCKGCCNPELQPLETKHLVRCSELVSIAKTAINRFDIEGVTFIGGEPTLQKGLCHLAKGLRALDLGIILFTGNLYEELDPDLKKNIDLIIDGRFECDNRDNERNLIGSTNQQIVNVTDRYTKCIEWFTSRRNDFIEVDLFEDGFITNGDAF